MLRTDAKGSGGSAAQDAANAKVYRKPTLTHYGNLSSLTASGLSNDPEPDQGGAGGNPNRRA